MFFGNSDPTFFAMMLSAFRRPGEDPTQVIKDLIVEFHQTIVLPGKEMMKKIPKIFNWKNRKKRQAEQSSKSAKHDTMKSADFELLAAFPVDRANPQTSKKVRLLRSSLGLLYGSVATVRVPVIGSRVQMALPLAMVATTPNQPFTKKAVSREFPNMEDPFELIAAQMPDRGEVYTDNRLSIFMESGGSGAVAPDSDRRGQQNASAFASGEPSVPPKAPLVLAERRH
ncbi:hypothetical protein K8S19_05910 [bacterium]|nr:hypothetical protein [bacterium]